MRITPETSKEEVLKELREELKDIAKDDQVLRNDCHVMLEKLIVAIMTQGVVASGLGILDIYDDRIKPDQAIRFYLLGAKAEAHVMVHTDYTISLDINDVGEEKFKEGHDKQHLRLLGETTTRRLPCCKQSMDVVMMLISSTRW